MKVVVDRGLCSTNAECTYAAPNVFRLVDGELDYDPTPAESERAAVEDAVSACPVQAITLLDD